MLYEVLPSQMPHAGAEDLGIIAGFGCQEFASTCQTFITCWYESVCLVSLVIHNCDRGNGYFEYTPPPPPSTSHTSKFACFDG